MCIRTISVARPGCGRGLVISKYRRRRGPAKTKRMTCRSRTLTTVRASRPMAPEEGGGLIEYMASLRKLLVLDLAVIYPAHGPAIRDPYKKLNDYISHRELREQQILDAMKAGLTEIPAMVKRIYTDVPEFLYGAAGQSVLSHLNKLKKESVI